jgi:hypothetical protein
MAKKMKKIGSENVAVFPTFKCDEDELAILTAMIAVCDKTKPVEGTMGAFESSPWIFDMDLANKNATDEDACLLINTGTAVSLCDIVGQDYWNSLNDGQRVAVGPCLLRMIDGNLLRAEFSEGEPDKSTTRAKSKIARKAK